VPKTLHSIAVASQTADGVYSIATRQRDSYRSKATQRTAVVEISLKFMNLSISRAPSLHATTVRITRQVKREQTH